MFIINIPSVSEIDLVLSANLQSKAYKQESCGRLVVMLSRPTKVKTY